jgi:general secretion pathway protein A
MYNQFFGLQRAPFSMTPDPALLFMPPQHREALAGLTYAILNRKGFAVLIGDAGTGKTTLLARVLRSLPSSRIHTSVIFNPTLTANELLELALIDFGITDVPESKPQRLIALQRLLLQNHEAGKASVLIIDEAHKLSPVLLEEIRLLSNFEFAEQKLLQIVLSGQNELGDILNQNDLRQLKQRISVRLSIGPLAKPELEQYIRHRWMKCGGTATLPFSPAALDAIATCSQGIPRLVNAICDNALSLAFGLGINLIDVSHILEVGRDLDLKFPLPEHREPVPVAKVAVSRPPMEAPQPIRIFETGSYTTPRPSLLERWTRKVGLSD